MKGMFSNVEGHLLRSKRAFSRKETDMSCEISWHFLFAWLAYLFHIEQIFLSQSKLRPLPQPLPRREGRNMWGYPYKTAIKGHNEAYILFIGVSRWLRPSLWGRGRGRGHYMLWVLCVLFFCVILWEKEHCRCVWIGFSLTEHTEFTEFFGAHFESTEGLRHTEFTERYC